MNTCFRMMTLFCATGLAGSLAGAQTINKGEPVRPLALLKGQPIYEQDLPPAAQGQLHRLEFQQYDQKAKALEKLIGQKLLELKARERNLSVEALLASEVDSTVTQPSLSELRAYYLGLRDRLNRPFEEVKTDLIDMLKRVRIQEARDRYSESLWKENPITLLLRPPAIIIRPDFGRLRGDSTAPISIVEFSDFQCPFCRRSEVALKQVLADYKGKVNLSYRDFPLSDVHPQAQLAAEASRCAGQQGKFLEFHDFLFENADSLHREGLLAAARELQLDAKLFISCLDSGQYKEAVERDVQDGIRFGVSATPGFFINGVLLEGAQSVNTFEKVIEQELSTVDRSAGKQQSQRRDDL